MISEIEGFTEITHLTNIMRASNNLKYVTIGGNFPLNNSIFDLVIEFIYNNISRSSKQSQVMFSSTLNDIGRRTIASDGDTFGIKLQSKCKLTSLQLIDSLVDLIIENVCDLVTLDNSISYSGLTKHLTICDESGRYGTNELVTILRALTSSGVMIEALTITLMNYENMDGYLVNEIVPLFVKKLNYVDLTGCKTSVDIKEAIKKAFSTHQICDVKL